MLVICILMGICNTITTAQNIIKTDSLIIVLNNSNSELEKAELMLSISKLYLSVAHDSVEKYAIDAIELFRKNSNPEKAIEALFILTDSYKYQGFIDQAISTIINHLKWIKKIESPIHEAICLRVLGEMSRASGQFDIGLNYIDDALQILISLNDSIDIAKCLNRKAAIYYEIKKMELAQKYADSSLFISKMYDDVYYIVNNLDILGAIYTSQNKYKEALSVQFESVSLSGRMDDATSILPNVYRNIAQTYFSMGMLKNAREYAEKSYAIAEKKKIWIYMENASEMLALIYEKTGNFKKAYRYSQITKGIRNNIFKREMSDKISELNTKYEAEKRERLIQAQHDEIIKNQLKFKQEETKRKLLYSGIFALFVIVLLLAYIYYQKRRDNLQITKQSELIANNNTELLLQKEEILSQSEQLKQSNKQLIELTKFKVTMTGMLVHDLKNHLTIIIGYSQMHIDDNHWRFVNESGKSMLNLVNNILDVQKYEKTEMVINIKQQVLNETLNSSFEKVNYLLSYRNNSFKNLVPENIIANYEHEIIDRVFVNILSNACKYSPQDGIITINSSELKNENGEFVKLSISNEGEAIPVDKIDTIFENYKQVNPKNLGVSYSTGIGLAYCKIAVNAQGGQIGVESGDKKGVSFWFTLPAVKEQ